MVEWHVREITQALCGSMKSRLKAYEMFGEAKLESNQAPEWSIVTVDLGR
jgi:hypothetical protein